MEISNELSELTTELEKAYSRGLIVYYSLNRCVIDANIEYVDLHITLCSRDFNREEPLRKYLRDRYGTLVRSILIEPHTRN
jgi:hypothetical protein